MKEVFVLLAFHAHEPLWDLPGQLLENVDDMDLRQTLGNENWLARRRSEGRDIYLDLINFARSMGTPVTLEATNELLVQLDQLMPETHRALRTSYQEGILYPLYGHAHHTHISLLTDIEVEDEIRLNREYLHEVMQAPRPRHPGLFPIEDSLDAAKLQGIKNSGIEFVIFPSLNKQKTPYRTDGELDAKHEPFLIGENIVALPRHFEISQDIWRPITKWKVEGVKNQGYMLGRYWVLPEEYRLHRSVRFPITREEAVDEYSRVLRKALAAAPNQGLLLYMQDLELMDFGDAALDILEASWKRVLKENRAIVNFVTPDNYIEKRVLPLHPSLRRVYFHQVSWAPEIRLVLRYDGHYPPLRAGRFRGRDATSDIFRPFPFIFWEPGRFMVQVVNSLFDIFSLDYRVGPGARRLKEIDYRFEEMSVGDQLALHSRIIKRACNWGWFPNEGLQKRPFLHAFLICQLLLKRLDGLRPSHLPPLNLPSFRGLERLPQIILDTRYEYLFRAITELSAESKYECRDAFRELDLSKKWREESRLSILKATFHVQRFAVSSPDDQVIELRRVITFFRDYCRAVFVSLDHLQRVWGRSGNIERLLQNMYDYLFELYPPLFPNILEGTLGQDERKALRNPELR
jgi:hypothetical protein